jgi:hypothetical protein
MFSYLPQHRSHLLAAQLLSAVTVVERQEMLIGRRHGSVGCVAVTYLLPRVVAYVRTATTLRALEGDARSADRQAVLFDGATDRVDAAIVDLGAVADTAWLRGSGLLFDDGMVCDAACRPDSLLAGRRTAVRHWSNACEQAAAAARTLLDGADAEPYVHVPSFWLDLDIPAGRLRLQWVRHTADADAVHVLDGDPTTCRALIAYGRAGRHVGAVSLDRPRHIVALRTQIAQGAEFPAHLPALAAGAA